MDLEKILTELRQQRQRVEAAILALEQVAGLRRRGRPPKWLAEITKQRSGPPEGSKNRDETAAD